MNLIRAQIFLALQALIEEENGVAFQRLAYQCLHPRWPSLMATAEKADMGEDGLTVIAEDSDGVIRSLACSLTNKWDKVKSDAEKIAAQRSDLQQFIFATPKKVTRKEQKDWEDRIRSKYGWNLTVVEYSEFIAILERPEAQWIREQHLGIYEQPIANLKPEEDPEALNAAAGQLWEKGANNEALNLYEHAHRIAIAQRNPLPACHALLGAAWCKLDSRNPAAAYGLAVTSQTIAEEAGDLHYRASALVVCARVALIQRNLKEAETCALSAVEDGKNAKSLVRYDGQALLVEIALADGDADKALRHLNSVYRRDLQSGGRRAIAAYDLRAAIHVARRKPRLASKFFEKAAAKARELGNLQLHASYLAKAQRALAEAGAYRAVLNRSEDCEKAARAIDNTPLLLEALMSKSWAYQQLRKRRDARQTIEQVAAIAESKSCHGLAARALIGYAQILRNEGNLSEGRAAAERALQFARASDRKPLVGLAQIEISEQNVAACEYATAQERFRDAIDSFRDIHLPADFRFEMAQMKLRILEGLGRYDEALVELDALISAAGSNDELKGTVEWAQRKRDELTGKIQWFATTQRLLKEKKPLAWAGTEGAASLQEAHQWVIGILMDWWDGTMGGTPSPCGVYAMWGEANYGRMLLNHSAFSKTANRPFHLCVEISSVREARLACRMLSPICDCLTLLWKGVLKPVILPIPCPFKFEEPIKEWKPRPPEYWEKGARAYNMVLPPLGRFDLPYPIVKFYMEEARDLATAGRLLLVPGPMVGCLGPGYKDTEDMFCRVAAAEPVIRRTSRKGGRHPLEMVVPWFPAIPLRDLAKLCEDHSECLVELRQKCLEWSTGVQNDQELLLAKIRTEIALLSRDVERTFKRVSGAASADSQLGLRSMKGFGGQAKREEIRSSAIRCESNNRMMAFMEDNLNTHPWFPYWSFEQRGLKLELGATLHSPGSGGEVPPGAIVNGNVFHWLKAPGEFATRFIMVPKDSKGGEAIASGDYKIFEVKGGRVSEVSRAETSNLAKIIAKEKASGVPQPQASHLDKETLEGKKQQGYAADDTKRRR